MYLQDVDDQKSCRREKAQNKLVFFVELFEADRREYCVIQVEDAFAVDRHLVELENVDEQKNQHGVDDHRQMKYV